MRSEARRANSRQRECWVINRVLKSIVVGLIVSLVVLVSVGHAQPDSFIYYSPPTPSAELLAALHKGMEAPREGAVQLRSFLSRTSDRALAGSLLAQIADFEGMAGDKTARRATLNQMIREFPNSNFEFEAANKLIDLDYGFEDTSGIIRAVDTLVQRFGGPALRPLADRQPAALNALRSLPPHLLESLGRAYSSLPVLYSRQKDKGRALAFAQLNREMRFPGEDPLSVLHAATGKSWRERTSQNPEVRILKPSSHRTGTRPRIVVEISDGDYREPQLNWKKFEFKLDGQDLKLKAMNKSQFDTKLRENHTFERLRMIYRPEKPLAPGQHTLLVYAPVHGYKGSGLGATRVEFRFQVPPPNQRTPKDRDDEGVESDDRDFH